MKTLTKIWNWVTRKKEPIKQLPMGQNKPPATQVPKVAPRIKVDMGETHAYTVAPKKPVSPLPPEMPRVHSPLTEKQIQKETRRDSSNLNASSSPSTYTPPVADFGSSSWSSSDCGSSSSSSSDSGGCGD